MKKIKPKDGLGPHEVSKIRSAVRQVWHRSLARRLAVKRCTDADGYFTCEECDKRFPSGKIDHIVAVGNVDGGFLERMFCPSSGLQGLCKKCHNIKTKAERAAKKKSCE